jgi:RNA polymerase sigma-70 factor (ECF subfamily)
LIASRGTRSDGEGLDALSAEALAARAQGGDRACFEELVLRLRDPLTAFLARRLPRAADADDVVQETFLRAYQNLDRYDPARRFSTWLFAIGKNVAANHRVRERRREDLSRTGEGPAVACADAGSDAGELWQTAERVLSPASYRALWLRYADDLSVAEVARELRRTVVATKVMLFRARRKLLQEES